MNVKEQQGETLRYLAIEPDGYVSERQYPMIVLLHGFGASMSDLARLTESISSDGYVYICPSGPMSVRLGGGMLGYAWVSPSEGGLIEEAQRVEEMLTVMLEEVMDHYQVTHGQAIIGGFSQGGMVSYYYGLMKSDLFRGVVALSAKVPHAEVLRTRLPAQRNQDIFIAHGTSDEIVSIDHARESLEFLEAEGYNPVYKEYPMGHEISQDVLDDLIPWIHGVIPPLL